MRSFMPLMSARPVKSFAEKMAAHAGDAPTEADRSGFLRQHLE